MSDVKKPSFRVLLPLTILSFAILCALGVWQLQRLEWKLKLIERIDTRIHQTPVSIQEITGLWAKTGDITYFPITLSGRFVHAQERHFYSIVGSRPGWEIFTPFVSTSGTIIVNRGFVPEGFKNPQSRKAGQVKGTVQITGLVRETGRRGMFVPDNEPEKNIWYWRDLRGMSYSVGLSEPDILPFYVDMQSPVPPGGLPKPGVTRLKIPNKHFSYALTWFALAGVLVVIVILFIRNSRRSSHDAA